jgi:hypothetical protein
MTRWVSDTFMDKLAALETENTQLRQVADQLCEENARLTKQLGDLEQVRRKQLVQRDTDEIQGMIRGSLAPYKGQMISQRSLLDIKDSLTTILKMAQQHHGVTNIPKVVVANVNSDVRISFDMDELSPLEQEFWTPRLYPQDYIEC